MTKGGSSPNEAYLKKPKASPSLHSAEPAREQQKKKTLRGREEERRE